jgi:hypothetical protein
MGAEKMFLFSGAMRPISGPLARTLWVRHDDDLWLNLPSRTLCHSVYSVVKDVF